MAYAPTLIPYYDAKPWLVRALSAAHTTLKLGNDAPRWDRPSCFCVGCGFAVAATKEGRCHECCCTGCSRANRLG